MFAARNMSLVRSGFDADALAYITAVEVSVSVSATQKTAINNFYLSAKSTGYYASLKRIYLPIWANATANAIDMISLASGSFIGGVTHASGYVQSNGTTGYFNTGATMNSLGVSVQNSFVFTLENLAGGASMEAVFDAGTGGFTIGNLTGTREYRSGIAGNRILDAAAPNKAGIFTMSGTSSTLRTARQRTTSGIRVVGTNTTSETGGTANNILALARSITIDRFFTGRAGSYGAGLGLSVADTDSFTLDLKTLWETCTGLTLP